MKILISESQLKLLTEQSNDSYMDCDKNISKTTGYGNVWKTMDPNKRNELIKELNSVVSQSMDKSRNDYIKWFKNPLTIKKFKTSKEREILKMLPTYLQSIKKINYTFSGPKSMPNSIAWVNSNNPTTINYNLSQIHNGNNFVGTSIGDTTKHEMGHLIDYFFKKNGVNTYIGTINTNSQQEYQANYIVNDRDQYTRLNVFRGVVNAGPADPPQTLLNKFLNQVNSGKITSNKYNFSGMFSKNGMTQKNNTEQATEIIKLLNKSIFVDGKFSLNIEQLFSNYAINKGGTIYVSFDLLAEQNFTSKDLEKKFYFLKMSPK